MRRWKSFIKKSLGTKALKRILQFRNKCVSIWLLVIGGSTFREKLLLWLLQGHYRSKFKRQWQYAVEPPHFFDHALGFFEFGFSKFNRGAYGYARAFYSAEVILPGDTLLDISCGEGSFTRRFLAERCARIDAIDIDKTAIAKARKYNASDKIQYFCQDAIHIQFPSSVYDVIVWDGAIGHFAAEDLDTMLSKISKCLTRKGIFTGSESIGEDRNSDHLTFFYSTEDFINLFQKHFRYVEIKSQKYRTGIFEWSDDRVEAYWRCSNDVGRFENLKWKSNFR